MKKVIFSIIICFYSSFAFSENPQEWRVRACGESALLFHHNWDCREGHGWDKFIWNEAKTIAEIEGQVRVVTDGLRTKVNNLNDNFLKIEDELEGIATKMDESLNNLDKSLFKKSLKKQIIKDIKYELILQMKSKL